MLKRVQTFRVDIKPLSVNDAWQGRRFKSKDYKQYEKDMQILLPRDSKIWDEPIRVSYHFKLRNAGRTDIDNLIKPLQDILVRSGIITNDNLIVEMNARKTRDTFDSVEVSIESAGVGE